MKQTVLCFGDSNTYGCCADPGDTRSHDPGRFAPEERWPGLLQRALGEDVLVAEAGASGRTTARNDPRHPGIQAALTLPPCLEEHAPVDLLVLMQGTNDTKERMGLSPEEIAGDLEELLVRVRELNCWRASPNILLLAPPPLAGIAEASMGAGSVAKSAALAPLFRAAAERTGCAFLDTAPLASLSPTDGTHLTRRDHRALAQALVPVVRALLGRKAPAGPAGAL